VRQILKWVLGYGLVGSKNGKGWSRYRFSWGGKPTEMGNQNKEKENSVGGSKMGNRLGGRQQRNQVTGKKKGNQKKNILPGVCPQRLDLQISKKSFQGCHLGEEEGLFQKGQTGIRKTSAPFQISQSPGERYFEKDLKTKEWGIRCRKTINWAAKGSDVTTGTKGHQNEQKK